MEEKGKLQSSLPYFIGGLALGAVAGILFAPKSGKETREDIAVWLKTRREQGSDLVNKLRDAIPAKKEQVLSAFRAGKEAYKGADNKKDLVNA